MTKNVTNTACEVPIRDPGTKYTTTSDALGIVSGLFVIQRVAYKRWAGLDFGWDDFFCLLTIISGVPATVINAYGLPQNGLGHDIWTLTPEQITGFLIYFYAIEILYFLEVGMLKLSLLLFYIRIFPNRRVHQLLWGTVAFVSVTSLLYTFLSIFQCTPISYFWTKWDGTSHGYCVDMAKVAWSNAGISIVVDVWMLATPLWQLRSLQLDWRKKLGVGLMFGVGTL